MSTTTSHQSSIIAFLKRVRALLWRTTSISNEVILCSCAIFFSVLTSAHLLNWDANWQTENALIVLCVTLIAASSCPQAPILALMLISSILWCESDLRSESSWWNYLLAYSVRCTSTALLVLLTSRAQQELKRARQAARVDALTGILNRRAIQERLEAELCRAHRYERPLSIVMLDCDGFKAINDRQGHQAGDDCLKAVARTLNQHARTCDHVGRLGGDEFVLIFPESDEDDALAIIERFRIILREELSEQFPSLTFSIGVSTIQPSIDRSHSPVDWIEGLRQADEAMYAAKRSGGDQTQCRPIGGSRC